tara:strand:+ start:13047 stop:13439 length:393 start_codon:yes stop_codon:yes gene_type:complete
MVKFKMVPNESKYYRFISDLRCDPRVQGGFIETVNKISDEDQSIYMNSHGGEYFICLYDNKPIGFVGSVDGDIRICVLPEYQRMGVGKFMLKHIIKEFPESHAKIKIDNEASQRMFEDCKFLKKYYIYEY